MNSAEVRCIYLKELTEIWRDWRTLLILVLLPMLSFPVGMSVVARVMAVRQHRIDTSALRIAVAGDGAAAFSSRLEAVVKAGRLLPDATRKKVEIRQLSAAEAQTALQQNAIDAIVSVNGNPDQYKKDDKPIDLDVQTNESKESAATADSVNSLIEGVRLQVLQERLANIGVTGAFSKTLTFDHKELSNSVERSGAWLGLTLPSAFIMMILLASLYPALDLITGERERGTLPLLVVAAVERRSIVLGKLFAVFTVGVIASTILTASILATLGTSVGNAVDSSGTFIFSLPAVNVLACLPLSLPLVVLFGSISVALSAYARNFQQGQGYSSPFVVGVVALSSLSVVPIKHLPPAIYMVPVVNIAVTLKNVLEGEINWLALTICFVSTSVYAWFMMEAAIGLVAKEETLFNIQINPARRKDFGKIIGVLYGVAFVVMFYFGQVMQVLDKIAGMIVTQLIVVALPAVVAVIWARKPLRNTLSLNPVSPLLVFAAALLAPSTVLLTSAIAGVQAQFLPMPESFMKIMTGYILPDGVPLWLILGTMAVMPGVCEELMFRGAILGLMRLSKPKWQVCIVVGMLFGLFHLSAYRLLPTGILGIFLCWLVYRTKSIYPSMALHAAHNGLAVLLTYFSLKEENPSFIVGAAVLLVASSFLIWRLPERTA